MLMSVPWLLVDFPRPTIPNRKLKTRIQKPATQNRRLEVPIVMIQVPKGETKLLHRKTKPPKAPAIPVIQPPPNSDILEEFVQFCHNHHTKGDTNLKKEQKKSVELMDILRRSKAPLSSFQATLEWHLNETGELQHWQTLKDTDKCKTRETLIKDLSNRCNCQAL